MLVDEIEGECGSPGGVGPLDVSLVPPHAAGTTPHSASEIRVSTNVVSQLLVPVRVSAA